MVDVVSGTPALAPLAGLAIRQGRIAAESIFGRPSRFCGVQATAVSGVIGLTVAMTGASEKALQRSGVKDYEQIYLHLGHHGGRSDELPKNREIWLYCGVGQRSC